MAERPILFSAPMVRAILDGTKTQTRRIVKPHLNECGFFLHAGHVDLAHKHTVEWREQEGHWFGLAGYVTLAHAECPYGKPSDRAWVREGHWIDDRDPQCAVMDVDGYAVDNHPLGKNGYVENMMYLRSNKFWRKRPSIHMPRWASRITLEITGVRVERLQDISEEDAQAEGVALPGNTCTMYNGIWRDGYRDLWEQINGPGSWDANPWVWVIEFRRIVLCQKGIKL